MLLAWYATALVATLAIEVPLYAAGLRYGWRTPWRRAVGLAAGVNLATHPLLWWLLLPWTAHGAYPWLLLGAEVCACLVEWLLLMAWLHRRDALLLALSVAANAASALLGIAVVRLIGVAG